jgi:hypothetical protein
MPIVLDLSRRNSPGKSKAAIVNNNDSAGARDYRVKCQRHAPAINNKYQRQNNGRDTNRGGALKIVRPSDHEKTRRGFSAGRTS